MKAAEYAMEHLETMPAVTTSLAKTSYASVADGMSTFECLLWRRHEAAKARTKAFEFCKMGPQAF
jgi:hypothetical protein